MLIVLTTILSFISAIASGVYAYQSGSVAAETVCVVSVLALAGCLWGLAFGDGLHHPSCESGFESTGEGE